MSIQSLTLQAVNSNYGTRVITLDTSSLVPLASSIPTNCSSVISKVVISGQGIGKANIFLNDTYNLNITSGIYTNLTTFYNSLVDSVLDQRFIISDNRAAYGGGTTTNSGPYTAIDTYLKTIENSQLPGLQLAYECLTEPPSLGDKSKLEQQLETSKARYESMKTPENNVSYYEGWFPLFRPMTESALFGIFAAALALLLFSILIFLQMRGIQLRLEFPEAFFTGFDLSAYSGYLYGGAGIGIVLGFAGHYYFRPRGI